MIEDIVKRLALLDWNLQPESHPFIKYLNENPPTWLEQIALDYLTDFDGEWDFDKDGPLGVIEVKRDSSTLP